jgi:hypothetical protein
MNDQDCADRPSPAIPDRGSMGIRHLLVWTACSAAYLAVSRVAFSWDEADFPRYFAVFSAAHTPSAGACLAGLLILVSCLYRGVRFPTYAGETLLVILGVQTLADVPRMIQDVLMQNFGRWIDIPLASSMLLAGTLGLIAWVWLLVATVRAPSWQWRLLFLILLLSPILRFAEFIAFSGFPFIAYPSLVIGRVMGCARLLLTGACLGIVMLTDWRRQPRYPWTHWVGILCCGWETLLQIAWMITAWIFLRV